MKYKKEKSGIKIEERNIRKIVTSFAAKVEHEGDSLSFMYPPKGPNSFRKLKALVKSDKLRMPTLSEIVSLFHATLYDNVDMYTMKIKKFIERESLWADTAVLYVEDRGIFIQDHPRLRDKYGRVDLNLKDLEQRLKKQDRDVRFVEFGSFKDGKYCNLDADAAKANPFLIALLGYDGVEKLGDIIKYYTKRDDYVRILDFRVFTERKLQDFVKRHPVKLVGFHLWADNHDRPCGPAIWCIEDEIDDELNIAVDKDKEESWVEYGPDEKYTVHKYRGKYSFGIEKNIKR